VMDNLPAGSRFVIRFPAAEGVASPTTAETPAAPMKSGD
jgi:hypothetical protein